MKLFLPLILIGAALALFVTYTNPLYQSSKSLAIQNASYDEALTKSAELHKIRDGLLSKRNSFSNDDVARLERLLPDNIDNIRLIIDINNIALRDGISLVNVSVGDIVRSGSGGNDLTSSGGVGSMKVAFSVVAPYSSFMAFLHDLEHSLRLLDVDKIDYRPDTSAGSSNPSGTYQVEVRTYWLH